MVNKNFTIVRGNSLQFRLNFVDATMLPDKIYLILKNKSSDTQPTLQLSLGEGIEKVQDLDSYDFYMTPSQTGELQLLNYIYQIAMITGSDYETIVEGKLIITAGL